MMVAYIGIKKGKMTGCITGFAAGILLDILAGSFIGLSALAYTVSGFISGYFHSSEDKKIKPSDMILIIALAVFVSSFIYFEIYFLASTPSQGFIEVIYKFVATTMIYTLLVSLILIFFPKKTNIELPPSLNFEFSIIFILYLFLFILSFLSFINSDKKVSNLTVVSTSKPLTFAACLIS